MSFIKYPVFFILFLSVDLIAQIPSGAVGDWPFDGNALDMSGNGNHGVVNGAVPAPDRFGQANKAYRFNGLNSKITVAHNTSIDIGTGVSFSFVFWMKSYPGNQGTAILNKHQNGTWNGYSFNANNQADPGYCTLLNHMNWYTASGALQDACSNGPVIGDTLWHFVVGTYDDVTNSTKLFIDNVLQSDVGQSSSILSNAAHLSFGHNAASNKYFYNGVLDGARLFKRVLAESEMTALYNEGGAPPVLGILDRRIHLDECTFQNPNNGHFTLKTDAYVLKPLAVIYDQLGEKVFQMEIEEASTFFNLQISPGIYFLQLVTNSKTICSKKLVVHNDN